MKTEQDTFDRLRRMSISELDNYILNRAPEDEFENIVAGTEQFIKFLEEHGWTLDEYYERKYKSA